jgi:hypothetical protein
MTRKTLIPLLTTLALAVAGAVTAVSGAFASGAPPSAVTELSAGKNQFSPNASIESNLRFVYRVVTIRSGGWLTFKVGPGDTTGEPHTMTVVNFNEVPTTVDEVFNCAACSLANGHFGPSGVVPILNAGSPGYNQRGDSILVFPAPGFSSVKVQVTAPTGTDLHFVCAIHPWMQGILQVR